MGKIMCGVIISGQSNSEEGLERTESAMVRIMCGVEISGQSNTEDGLEWNGRSARKGWKCLLVWTGVEKVEAQLSEKGIRSYSRVDKKGIDQGKPVYRLL